MLNIQNSAADTLKNPKTEIQTPTIRILLWDIDGTLLHSTRAGSFREFFAPAMKAVYGSSGRLENTDVSGMTDSQIVCEALTDEGFSPEDIFAKINDFTTVLGEKMAQYVSEQIEPYRIMPGAREILEATNGNSRFVNALLTGNFTGGAEIKLKYFDLWKYFENQPNTFGEISQDRRKLAKTAAENVSKFLKAEVAPDQFIVIGDTANDVACARALNAKIALVATGRNQQISKLAKYKPDVLLEDLSETTKVLQILENL